MGRVAKEDFNRRSELENCLKFTATHDFGFGHATILCHPPTQGLYLMRQTIFATEEAFAQELTRLRKRRNISSPGLVRLIDFSTTTKIDRFHRQHTVRCFYEYPGSSLSREIAVMRQCGGAYSNEEITFMLMQLLDGLSALEQAGLPHGDITPGAVFITSHRRFVLMDSLRAEDAPPQNQVYECFSGNRLYAAPEVFEAIERRSHDQLSAVDLARADVFSLGLTLLEAGTLSDASAVYPQRNTQKAFTVPNGIWKEKLDGLMGEFGGSYYQNRLVVCVLQAMLATEAGKRPLAAELRAAMPSADLLQVYFANHRAKAISRISERPAKSTEKSGRDLLVVSAKPVEKKQKSFLDALFETKLDPADVKATPVSQLMKARTVPLTVQSVAPDGQNSPRDMTLRPEESLGASRGFFDPTHSAQSSYQHAAGTRVSRTRAQSSNRVLSSRATGEMAKPLVARYAYPVTTVPPSKEYAFFGNQSFDSRGDALAHENILWTHKAPVTESQKTISMFGKKVETIGSQLTHDLSRPPMQSNLVHVQSKNLNPPPKQIKRRGTEPLRATPLRVDKDLAANKFNEWSHTGDTRKAGHPRDLSVPPVKANDFQEPSKGKMQIFALKKP